MSASLTSAGSQHVGQVFYYSRDPEWLYMSVDMGSGDGIVTCQVMDATGRVATVGSFKLADGYEGAYRARLNANLAFWDSLDGNTNWPIDEDGSHPLWRSIAP